MPVVFFSGGILVGGNPVSRLRHHNTVHCGCKVDMNFIICVATTPVK